MRIHLTFMPNQEFQDIPLLDTEQIEMLTDTGDDSSWELLEDLAGLFSGETAELMASLDTLYATEDAYKVERSVHAIAGSSANIGGKRLWAVAKHVESLAVDNNLAEAELLTPLLRSTLDETMAAINKKISDLKGG